MRAASSGVISANSFSRSPRSAEISSELRCHVRSWVNASLAAAAVAVTAPQHACGSFRVAEVVDDRVVRDVRVSLPWDVAGREPENAGRARRDRNVRVHLALEGFELDLPLREGPRRAQPRVRVIGQLHGVVADLRVELHLEDPADAAVAP
jgi:hypothetical protein